MLDDTVECASFTPISIDSWLNYDIYYLQVYLDNCACKIVNTQMIDYKGNLFESDEH